MNDYAQALLKELREKCFSALGNFNELSNYTDKLEQSASKMAEICKAVRALQEDTDRG